MTRDASSSCARSQVPGDTYRNLVIHPTFSGRTFKHILVPIWLLTYVFGSRTFQVVVNGSTGRMAGQYPNSGWKVFFAVTLMVIIMVIIAIASES